MASKSKSSDNLKQKSLMSFFGKSQNGSSSKAQSTPKAPSASSSSSATKSKNASKVVSSSPAYPETPLSEGKSFQTPKSVNAPSSSPSVGSSVKETPPTSDVIDVDMISSSSAGEDSSARVKTGKRKIVLEDSDEEEQASRRSSSVPDSSPVARASRNKKARLSQALSEEEEEEDAEVKTSFTQRLTKFKKSPAKKGRSRSDTDDDDFIVPSEDEDDAKSVKSSSSRASSRRSMTLDDDEHEDEDDRPKKSRPKPKKTASASAVADTTGSSSFLTAAERREQDKKNEKKAQEDPYSFLLDVKDKDGRRPGDPKYDPRTLFIPPKAWKDFTPFEKQFWEIKQNHNDTILFFQKGKFFELYEDDARVGHQEFDLKLTQRVKMSMVGVPEMAFNFWAAKFLGKGYKVGRVDQAETALGAEMRLATDKKNGKPRGGEKEKIVRRELNKVYTNGTLVDGEMITDDEAGHCISIREQESPDGSHNTFGVCVLDCSTSQFNLSTFEDDICRTKLETLIRQIRPKEMVFTKGNLSVSTTRLLKSIIPAACLWTGLREVEGLDYEATLKELKERYPAEDDGTGEDADHGLLPQSVPGPIREMADSKCAVEALGGMIWYLQQLNIDKDILSMKNFNIYDPMKKGEGLVLDGQTLAHIGILLNDEGTEEGSLLKLLNRCVTPFGKRLFRIWLCMPLRDIGDINARLDAVEDLLNSPTFEGAFADIAKGLPDLERVVSRIHAKNCSVKDFLKVLASFKKLSRGLNDLADASESFNSKTILGLLRSAPDLLPNIKNIESMFVKPAADKDTSELVPRKGKDESCDEIVAEIETLENELDGELEVFEKKLGCKLNWWHSAVGNKDIYLVETSASQKNVPKDWTKSGGTKAKSRWLVSSLQKSVRSLKEARENRNTAIKEFKYRLFAEFDADRSVWLRATRVFAELDCLLSLAKSSAAIGEPACRPEFVEGDSAWMDFRDLRHPTLAMSTRLQDFIPNNVKLGGDVGKIALLTGPNMAGKSTVMRMTAMGVIMAQLGMFVPAEKARLCPLDAILTRMGAYDNMFSNSSTFKVEMDECCKILRDATPKSFVILDELGRGTSTYDGMAIAGAVLHQLATHTQPLSFFATHYGSLTDDFAYHPNIRTMHMSTLVDDEKRAIIFLYKLIEGVATSSFGTHVANLAGVPLDVVERAEVISKNFAEQFKEKLQAKQQKSASAKLPLTAQADFAYLVKLASGQLTMPDDPARQKAVLSLLKKVVQKYIS